MKVFVVVLISVALLHQEANAGPIWDRARRMFGWDKPEEQTQNQAVAPPPHSYGGPQGYPASGPPQKAPAYGPPAPPGASPVASAPYSAPGGYGRPSYPRPGLQHTSSALYGSYASPSYAGPTYAKAPYGYPSSAGYPGSAYASAGYPSVQGYASYGSQADYGSAPSASNSYGGLFSVVDQTSQIGQLANGDLAASPSESYSSSNEDVMKSLLKMVDKPFDLEAAATAAGSHYYQQNPHLAFSPGPHPIMEADRNVIRYRTSPIQIGVADGYGNQHVVGHATGLSSSYGHGIDTSAYTSSGLGSSGLSSAYGGDLHTAASSAKKSVSSSSHSRKQ
ncbi:spidroin-2-like [Galendromus occidentalis]|uniref:Spidroin-2-like n=1 Tax=Galendromus occidentalis TaxID=34638 RepID=A0AAJ7L7Y6_9ACAR|nr:spidroin-2-like [Galendromus occidentalis]